MTNEALIKELRRVGYTQSLAGKAATAIEAAESQLTALRLRVDWQPIESAPKDGSLIDVWCPAIGRFADVQWVPDLQDFGRAIRGYEGPGWSHYPNSPPTHWMPHPDAPTPTEGEKP